MERELGPTEEERRRQVGLTERARAGDAEAFGELVGLHRQRAFRIARKIVHDPYAAEDVVQDALCRAFLHIDRLADVDRFVPWLSRIVRNQALMARRSEQRAGRIRFLADAGGRPPGDEPDASGERGDLDGMLYRLTRSQGREGTADPERELIRREFYTAVHGMLHSLSSRERELFEAHFFSQLTPSEIAALSGMTEANVYKTLSRSKAKVKEERIRHYVRERMDDDDVRHARVALPIRPDPKDWSSGADSAAVCFRLMMQAAGQAGIGLSETMGWSGHAFRLSVERRRIDVSGPSMYYWEPVFERGLDRLGFGMRHVGDGGIPPTAYMVGEAAALARRSIASGMPVMAWGIFGPEFALLHGYDDERQSFVSTGRSGLRHVPYDRLGRGADDGLFVLAAVRRSRAVRPDPDRETPRLVADLLGHAYGERTFVGYAAGLGAIDAWIEAMRGGEADPLGSAYCIRVAADAREHAVRFLRGLTSGWEGERARRTFEAEGRYYESAGCWARLAGLFPFPEGRSPDRETAAEAVRLLETIRDCEEAGVEALEKLARQF
ncbi:sigma-70 family RNA polymerase sigma factor [Paenibacillus flagellatus]|nr:sigma-70 family RNA polymerase sigma factor [Paenibacillus flagellatus]